MAVFLRRIPAVDALLGDSYEANGGCTGPDGATWFLTENRLLRLKDGIWSLRLASAQLVLAATGT